MKRSVGILALLLLAAPAFAAITFFDNDKANFMAQTGAGSLTPLPAGTYISLTNENLVYSSPNSQIFVSAYSIYLPTNVISLGGLENLDVGVFSNGVYSIGFDFSEGASEPLIGSPFVDSTFAVEAFTTGMVSLGSYAWGPPNDVPGGSHFGVWADSPIIALRIRETTGGDENEFYGPFQVGTTPVPEPSVLALGVSGLAALAAARRRK